MDNSLIIVLAIILLILIVLNHITIVTTTTTTTQGNCGQTTFGCCPNGVDSKINFYGTNCPNYKPLPGYPTHQPIPPPPVPPPPPGPGPMPPKPIGGCAGTQFGCCINGVTPKINLQGSNCK
jgi:hypothetical protein